MELLWMILPVFLVCAEAENVTEVKAELGQNVTLNCSVEVSDIYWYMEIHNQFRVQILRTFGKTDDNPHYCDPEFKTKYSVLENRLVITNVTAEDFRRYFCAQNKNGRIRFEGTISLVSDSITPSNDSKTNNNQQPIQGIWQSQTVLFSLFAFVLLLIGESVSCFLATEDFCGSLHYKYQELLHELLNAQIKVSVSRDDLHSIKRLNAEVFHK
ncbi:uncharacterized protein LOC122976638 [Thunnus albacares]|uniref:uncharacterized protein LOC122976638 n=1 Tax=Thunnus albacares TaxID=8236 RepID=UPI001CF71B1D|nr:uncharacterized protein LOC122976638 [Thunnus albacares]